MHGFHATEGQCAYGLAMFGISFGLAGIMLTMVLLLI